MKPLTQGLAAVLVLFASIEGDCQGTAIHPTPRPFTATLEREDKPTATLRQSHAAEAELVDRKSVFRFVHDQPNFVGLTCTLRILEKTNTERKKVLREWKDDCPGSVGNGQVIRFNQLPDTVGYGQLVELFFEGPFEGGRTNASYFFEYRKRLAWSRIHAPLLLRLQGDLNKISWRSLEPQLAGGPRFVFGAGRKFIGVYPALGLNQRPEADGYRASYGLIVDGGTYVQLGYTIAGSGKEKTKGWVVGASLVDIILRFGRGG